MISAIIIIHQQLLNMEMCLYVYESRQADMISSRFTAFVYSKLYTDYYILVQVGRYMDRSRGLS